jgi:hypothetical protein
MQNTLSFNQVYFPFLITSFYALQGRSSFNITTLAFSIKENLGLFLLHNRAFKFTVSVYARSGLIIITAYKWKDFADVYQLKDGDILTLIMDKRDPLRTVFLSNLISLIHVYCAYLYFLPELH